MFKYRLPKLDLGVLLERECIFHLSRFIQNVIDLVPTRARNWSLWVPLGRERTQKRGLQNIHKIGTTKCIKLFEMWSKKTVRQNVSFVICLVPIPGWSPWGPGTSSKDKKRVQTDAWTQIFTDFNMTFLHSLEHFSRCLVCSVNTKFIIF